MNSSTSGSSSNSRSNGTNAATSDTYDLVWVKAEKVSDVQRISNLIKQAGFETYSLNDMLETVKKQSKTDPGCIGSYWTGIPLSSRYRCGKYHDDVHQ